LETDCGTGTEIIGIVLGILALYGTVREMVRDQGRSDAYRDLGLK
jgi:hypothetical protein